MPDYDFIRDEDKVERPRNNPYVDYSRLGRVVDGKVVYPVDQSDPEQRLSEYVQHEGNADAQADMRAVSLKISKMSTALHDVKRSKTAFNMLSHAVQDRINELLK